jgi:hypothetical protein
MKGRDVDMARRQRLEIKRTRSTPSRTTARADAVMMMMWHRSRFSSYETVNDDASDGTSPDDHTTATLFCIQLRLSNHVTDPVCNCVSRERSHVAPALRHSRSIIERVRL